jgi:tetratricopeptide (TPR) repeat protein
MLRLTHRVLIALLAGLSAASAMAEMPGDIGGKFKVNDVDPTKGIPSIEERNTAPIEFAHFLQDLIARAEPAFRERKWDRAVKYYEAIARTVPDRAFPYSRLCSSYAELGKIEIAAANCQKAIRLDGARVADHLRMIELKLREKELSASDIEEVDASVAALRSHQAKIERRRAAAAASSSAASPAPAAAPAALEPKSKEQVQAEFEATIAARQAPQEKPVPDNISTMKESDFPVEIEVLACRFAVRVGDPQRLQPCIDRLRALKVDEKLVLPFAWSLALFTKDQNAAEVLFQKAKGLGLPESTISAMRAEEQKVFGSSGLFSKRGTIFGLLALIMLALGVVGVRWFRLSASKREKQIAANPST